MTNGPKFLRIEARDLGRGTSAKVHIVADPSALAEQMATDMIEEIESARMAGRAAVLIIPVGPVDQYEPFVRRISDSSVRLDDVTFIAMDEYLTDAGEWIDADHPLSFRGFLDRLLYDALPASNRPRVENRIVPDPHDLDRIPNLLAQVGPVDCCFAGVGINGHLAFNEPPELDETVSTDAFADRPTRVLRLSRETRTINAVTVGGEISVIPTRAVTIGMREILSSRRIRLCCNRPWQRGIIRRLLHGPVDARCPASLLQRHPDVRITLTEEVAAKPDIRLR